MAAPGLEPWPTQPDLLFASERVAEGPSAVSSKPGHRFFARERRQRPAVCPHPFPRGVASLTSPGGPSGDGCCHEGWTGRLLLHQPRRLGLPCLRAVPLCCVSAPSASSSRGCQVFRLCWARMAGAPGDCVAARDSVYKLDRCLDGSVHPGPKVRHFVSGARVCRVRRHGPMVEPAVGCRGPETFTNGSQALLEEDDEATSPAASRLATSND